MVEYNNLIYELISIVFYVRFCAYALIFYRKFYEYCIQLVGKHRNSI